jgi:arylsulfatase A-like enzyme
MPRFWLLAALCLCLPCIGLHARSPNILVVLADDQGWGDLGINGNTNLHTPHIDSIGRAGARFERFFVSPVCSPTRAEFLTGRYHPRGNVYSTSTGGERLNLGETTLAEVFRRAGYATGAFGKWHNGMQYPYHPNGRGFDEFYGFCSGHWGNYFSPLLEHNGQIVRGNGFLPDDLTDRAMAFMETNKDRPFLCYVPFNTPHSPMQMPDEYWDRFKSKELPMRHRDPDKEDVTFTRAALAMTENLDWNVGRLLRKLDDLGLAADTIVVYFSDNGPNSWRWNGGMKGMKGSTDEGGVRSPLLIRWPGHISAGKRIEPICSTIDLLPTFAALAGVEPKTAHPIDGLSLAGLLRGEGADRPERFVYSFWNDKLSVRGQDYRLDSGGGLFDLRTDPGQRTNLAQHLPRIAERMAAAGRVWREDVLREFGPAFDHRPFLVGHPDFKHTQLPARDGKGGGNIVRSSRHPNSSFFTHWISTTDSITWDVEVAESGEFEVELYYTCPAADVGSTVQLGSNGAVLQGRVGEAHDSPWIAADKDRVPRTESYEKDFRPLKLGRIRLEKGGGVLTLKATEIPGSQVMDFRLMMLTRRAP